jgi:hypothetical protein
VSEVSVPKSPLSMFAVYMLVALGVFTIIFYNIFLGVLILILALFLYKLHGWLTVRFARGLANDSS